MKVTSRQIHTALKYDHLTPQKRSGRPSLLSLEQTQILIQFVCASLENRRMPYHYIPTALNWGCSEHAIRYALQKAGYRRYIACRKPSISEANRQARLEWALEHVS